MRFSKKTLGTLFGLVLTTALVLSAAVSFHIKTVKAGAQDASRVDVKQKEKNRSGHHPTGITGVAPLNDNCANAISVNGCPFTNSEDTTGASDETGEPQSTCTLQANSVWYTVPANTKTRLFTVETCNSDFDTAVMVWQVNAAQPCNFASFAPVACNDDACGDGLQSRVSFTANPNTVYKIQVGGFDGETGALTIDISCQTLNCDPLVIHGTLGSGSNDFDGQQLSGLQTGRLNRNGVASTCAAPKACQIFDPANSRAFDAYFIPNQSGQDACVSVNLFEDAAQACNIQSNAYLNTYNPASICTGYLADPGLSTGVPPTATNFSFVVPAGQTLIVVVHTTNPGESGCPYTLTILGDLCRQFDFCVQDDNIPARFIEINSTTGDYEYHDCSKGVVVTGRGVVSRNFCKIQLTDSGPVPKSPDRSISVLVNPCTMTGTASVRPPGSQTTANLSDSNLFNNNCECH